MLVIGAGGGIATMAISLAVAAGAGIAVTSSSADTIERAVAAGARGGVLHSEPDWPVHARAMSPNNAGFDLILDPVGRWSESIRALRPGGRLAVLGANAAETAQMDIRSFYFGQFDLLGTTMGSSRDFAGLLNMIDPLKLNAMLTAVADGVRGQGQRIGEATTDLNEVLQALNARSDTIGRNWRSLRNFGDTYDAAARDILTILNATSTTSTTIVNHSSQLEALLLNVIGVSNAGTNLLGASRDNLVAAVDTLEPTTSLLNKYSPEYACFLQGAKWYLDNGGYAAWGGADGRTLQLDVALLLGNDPYVYPDNLPIVAAKGGPGSKPGCGSLPDATKSFPVRELVTDTGWGTGIDIRPNPGIGHPCWADYFPVTRAVPRPPSVRQCIPGPAIGPNPAGPPYGAALYGPGGVPLWPGVQPAPAAPAPAEPGP